MMIWMIDPWRKSHITKEEVTMRFVFAALIFSVCGLVHGQDAGQTISVLNHGSPTPAAAPAPAAAPTAVVAADPAPATVVVASPSRCRNGRCCTGPNCRLYNVEESVSESCRPRLFGGYVKTNTARTVYRPARR
jgi:hypothetical protein